MKEARMEGLAEDTCSSAFRFMRWLRENVGKLPFRGQELVGEIEEMCANCHLDIELFVEAFLQNMDHLADFTKDLSPDVFHILHYAPGENLRELGLADISNIARAGRSALIQNVIFKWYILRQNRDEDFDAFSVRKISKWDFNEICMRHLDRTSLETLLKNKHDVMHTQSLISLLLNQLQQSDKLFLLHVKSLWSFDKILNSVQTHEGTSIIDIVDGSCKVVDRQDYSQTADELLIRLHDEVLMLQKIVKINLGMNPEPLNLTPWQSELFSQVLQPYFCNTAPPQRLEQYRAFVNCKNFGDTFCTRPTFSYFAMQKWMTQLRPVLKQMEKLDLDVRNSYCDLCYHDYKRLEAISKEELRFFVAYDLLDRIVVYRARFADNCDIGVQKGHVRTLMQKIGEMQDLLDDMVKSLVSDAQEIQRFLTGRKKIINQKLVM